MMAMMVPMVMMVVMVAMRDAVPDARRQAFFQLDDLESASFFRVHRDLLLKKFTDGISLEIHGMRHAGSARRIVRRAIVSGEDGIGAGGSPGRSLGSSKP
jgi:hypothetical protein